VIVIGAGVAGVVAAIEAFDRPHAKLKILIVEKFDGGGSSVRSGGAVYAGGGTDEQEVCGVKDSFEETYNYLKTELKDSVSDDLLRLFCERSSKDTAWLRNRSVSINKGDETSEVY